MKHGYPWRRMPTFAIQIILPSSYQTRIPIHQTPSIFPQYSHTKESNREPSDSNQTSEKKWDYTSQWSGSIASQYSHASTHMPRQPEIPSTLLEGKADR